MENSIFFLLFLLITVLLHLSQLSLQVWQRPYPKQTHACHVGSAVLLESVHPSGSVHPSDKFREDSRKWSTAGDVWILSGFTPRPRVWVAVRVWARESSGVTPPAQDGGAAQLLSPCCPSLPKQKLFGKVLGQQRLLGQNICLKGWGLPDQAHATLGISDELPAKRVLRRVSKVRFSRPLLPTPYDSFLWPAQFPCTT